MFQNAFESAFTALLAGIPVRAGYPTDLRGPLLNIKIPLTTEIREKHQVFYYLGITDFIRQRFGAAVNGRSDTPDCSVSLSDERVTAAKELLGAHAPTDRPLFCLCPGSVNSEAKRWPADYFARLADLLATHYGAKVVFLGAREEQPLIDGIISQTQRREAMNLAGRTDLIGSMAVMRVSDMVVSNDTGSAHMAVAAGSTVLTVFGPTSVGATAPFGPTAYTIEGRAPCAPCRHFRCPLPDHPCMRGIVPEDVLRKIAEIRATTGHGI
jgi:heptosyltransferase-2